MGIGKRRAEEAQVGGWLLFKFFVCGFLVGTKVVTNNISLLQVRKLQGLFKKGCNVGAKLTPSQFIVFKKNS